MLKTFELSFKPRPLRAGVFDKGCSPLDNRVQTEWVGTEWEEVNGEEVNGKELYGQSPDINWLGPDYNKYFLSALGSTETCNNQ